MGKVCWGVGEVRRGKQEGRVTGQQRWEWVGHGQVLHRTSLKNLADRQKEISK